MLSSYRAASILGQHRSMDYFLFFSTKILIGFKKCVEFYKKISSDVKRCTNKKFSFKTIRI